MTPTPGLAGLIGTMREDAVIVRVNGATEAATVKQRDADLIEQAEPDALRWLSEDQATIRTGWSLVKVRRHMSQYVHTGHARRDKSKWYALAIVLPQRLPKSLADAQLSAEAAA